MDTTRALAIAFALPLAACTGAYGDAPASKPQATSPTPQPIPGIAAAVAAPTRTEANRARDVYRHPVETLNFFGVKPGDTIVEIWPGGGWYTEILAPLTTAGGGTLYAAAPWNRLTRLQKWQADSPDVYGKLRFAEFPAVAGSGNPAVPAGTADVVLTFRNVHNWRFDGTDQTAEAFRQIHAMLKPGGVLGVVEHRLDETMDSKLEESSGYMKTTSVIRFAEAAGFKLLGASEVNANPKDTKDYPKGVWTLPPVLREGDTDRAKYLAIGESDRMTLKFVKPK